MTKGTISPEYAGNELLARLPADEWGRIRPLLQPLSIRPRTVLYGRHQMLDHVYFLSRGCVSLLIDFSDGFQAEAGLIGPEGMVGVPLSHGINTDLATAVVQMPSVGVRMSALAFLRELAHMPTLARIVLRHAEAQRTQAMQLAACNGHHGLEARLARCILGVQDRFPSVELPFTHEAMAVLLCAHRPSVSVAAKRLQQAGLIRYAAGSLSVLNRPGLEAVSCECYRVIRTHMTTVLNAA